MSVYTLINYGAGTWGTLSSFFFFMAAVFSDLLLIRLTLTLAYVFLLIAAFMGMPAEVWGPSGWLPVGTVVWAGVSGK